MADIPQEAVEAATEAMSATDDAAFDPDCPSPCFPKLARAALEAARPFLVAQEREDHPLDPADVLDLPAERLSPAQALQAARAMEYAETLNKRPDLYVHGADFKEARLVLERMAAKEGARGR